MKRYRVNASEHFNLMSMYDHLMNMRDDARAKHDIDAEVEAEIRLEELDSILGDAYGVGALVSWPVLKRIREIQAERQMLRYNTCLAAGSTEQEAALAFTL